MLSAIHYNFSFGPLFFTELVKNTPSDTNADLLHKNTLKESTSSIYLQLARNFLEEGWLITYLFGASPHAHESYLKIPSLPYATSLRMSKYGYFSRTQCQRAISFNSLEEYISDLKKAVSTPFPEYKKYKKQLNDHLLQIENEHYTRIRPKTDIFSLEKEGISYVEVRSLDVNPFEATGVSLSQLDFIKNFLFYCALKPHHGLEKKRTENAL